MKYPYFVTTMNKRENALTWWSELKPHIQQMLQTKYYPDDDFMVTNTSSERIQQIWTQEYRNFINYG